MDGTNLILTQPVPPPVSLNGFEAASLEGRTAQTQLPNLSEEQEKQVARDFESVLLHRVLDQMKDTIVDWGSEKDGTSKQVQGIFWLYLARDIADNGGFGLWKDIYKFMSDANHPNSTGSLVEKNV